MGFDSSKHELLNPGRESVSRRSSQLSPTTNNRPTTNNDNTNEANDYETFYLTFPSAATPPAIANHPRKRIFIESFMVVSLRTISKERVDV
jgi:hypothetical protein